MARNRPRNAPGWAFDHFRYPTTGQHAKAAVASVIQTHQMSGLEAAELFGAKWRSYGSVIVETEFAPAKAGEEAGAFLKAGDRFVPMRLVSITPRGAQ